MKNKIMIIVRIIYICLFLYAVYLGFCESFPSGFVFGISRNYVNRESYKNEYYNTLNKDLSFTKYYYHEEEGRKKVESMDYNLVGENIEIIKDMVDNIKIKFNDLDKPIILEFNYASVTSDDYYSIKSNSEMILLHYYDLSDNVLYIISYSI